MVNMTAEINSTQYSICSRVDKLNNYLVGDGLWSKIPHSDLWFYRLAGQCSHASWPRRPSDWKPPATNLVTDVEAINRLVANADGDSPKDPNDDPTCNTGNPDFTRLFRPIPNLPPPVFRQTYRIWKSTMDMNLQFRKIRRRHHQKICIQPLDEFPPFVWDFVLDREAKDGLFGLLQEFVKIFFMGMDAELLPAISTTTWKVTEHYHKLTGQKQLLVDDVHRGLAKMKPKGVQAILGITWTDLYPAEELNFVLGQASVTCRSAVMCFGRFETKMFEAGCVPTPITKIDDCLIYKMIKVLAHETCHVFYLGHCFFYDCLMNESSSVTEAVAQPLFLCPICIRKLQKVCKFDILKRYALMLDFLISINIDQSSVQLKKSIEWLQEFRQWANRQNRT